jgi:error-prone DNA polymerase
VLSAIPRRPGVAGTGRPAGLPGYAELHCSSCFSFLSGASQPGELVRRAQQLGYAALAITDECSLAGVVRAHAEAKRVGLHLIIGTEMQLTHPPVKGRPDAPPGPRLVLLAQSRRGYGNLSQWVTVARRRAAKGEYLAHPSDVEGRVPHAPYLAGLPDCIALLLPGALQSFETVFAHAMWLKTWFGAERAFIAVELLHQVHDALLADVAQRVAQATGLALVATGGVLMHARSRKPLQDMLSATRLNTPVRPAARRWPPTPSSTCAARGWPRTNRSGWRTRWSSPAAAASRWPNCATNTRARSCPPATRRPRGCARA